MHYDYLLYVRLKLKKKPQNSISTSNVDYYRLGGMQKINGFCIKKLGEAGCGLLIVIRTLT